MNVILITVLCLLAIPAAFSCSYLFLLTLLSGREIEPRAPRRTLRFDVIVPAHDEEVLIGRAVASLLQLDWPKELFTVLVVADNCTDETAARARAAGAQVLERCNEQCRGKGYALEFGLLDGARQGRADAAVVVDADSQVSRNLLTACATRIDQGAHAVQVHYGVIDPLRSWRTRLMSIAMAAFHRLRSRARERMHLSCGLRGNGWCVTYELLRRVPYRAFSLAEDIEYGIELGLAGYRVQYADEASVDAEMETDSASAAVQRHRWELGRLQLMRAKTGALLLAALRRRSLVCFDLALDLLVLPLSYIVLNVLALSACAGALLLWNS